MDPIENIRRLGFKRWYERQLIDSHACLVTALLAGILIAICIESVHLSRFDFNSLQMLAIIFVMGLVAIGSGRRFSAGLSRAEHFARKSVCPRCNSYAKFSILSNYGPGLRVRCLKCPSEWTLS